MLSIKKYEESFSSRVKSRPIYYFLIPLFFFLYVDSMLAYYFPVATEKTILNNSLLGVIMAFSSIVGLICDFVFPYIFSKKKWSFFLIAGIICALLFPTLTYFAMSQDSVLLFFISSIVWGIYYELFQFGIQAFIVTFEERKFFTRAWSLIILVWGLGTATGPILASQLIHKDPLTAFITFIVFQVLALITTYLLIKLNPDKNHKIIKNVEIAQPQSHVRLTVKLLTEAKYWELIISHIWPIVILSIMYSVFDAAFWTFGGL